MNIISRKALDDQGDTNTNVSKGENFNSNQAPLFSNSLSETDIPFKLIPNPKLKNNKGRSLTSRDEMNLAEFPLAVLSTRVDTRIKTLEFTDYTKGPNNEMVERRWIITGADKFGLPTSTDDDVVLGLIRLSMEQGFRDPKVYFTRYELLKALRWSTEGRSYHRLIKSLDRLSGVRIRSSNSFYDNLTKSYQTSNFGIIDAYEINDERATSNEPASFFIWSEMLFNSFKSGYIKKLDLDLYFTLKSAVARRLYRYLDKHFYFKSAIDAHLLTLAFEKIGLSRTYKYVSSIKQQMRPALEELVQVGFLSSYEFIGDSESTILRCIANAENVSSKHIKPEKLPENNQIQNFSQTKVPDNKINTDLAYKNNTSLKPRQALLVGNISERGLSLKQAEKLVLAQDESAYEKMETILLYFDHLVNSADSKVSKNSVGFLYRAMENPFKIKLPKSFIPTGVSIKKTVRPEHKVIRAKRVENRETSQRTQGNNSAVVDNNSRNNYNSYIENELNCIMTRIAPVELGQLFAETENKMKTLKKILGEDKFQEAIDGCVRDELRRRFRLPQFEEWIRNDKNVAKH